MFGGMPIFPKGTNLYAVAKSRPLAKLVLWLGRVPFEEPNTHTKRTAPDQMKPNILVGVLSGTPD